MRYSNKIRRFPKVARIARQAVTTIEYALIAALVAIGTVPAMTALGTSLSTKFTGISGFFTGASQSASTSSGGSTGSTSPGSTTSGGTTSGGTTSGGSTSGGTTSGWDGGGDRSDNQNNNQRFGWDQRGAGSPSTAGG